MTKLKNVFFLLVSCIILIIMIWKIGPANIYIQLSKANYFLLMIVFLLNLLSIFIKAYRWSKIFIFVKEIDAWKIYMIGMAINQIMPTGSGELTRVYLAKNKMNIPTEHTIVPVVVERIADTTFIFALSIAYLTFWTFKDINLLQLGIPLIVLSIGYSLLLKPEIIDLLSIFKFNNFTKRIIDHISKSFKMFRDDKGINNKIKMRQMVFLTIVSWCVYGLGIYVLLTAFGYYMPFFNVLSITTISELIGAFSFIPGGLGAKDLSFAALFTTLGIPIEIGISLFLIERAMVYFQFGIGAFISLISLNIR